MTGLLFDIGNETKTHDLFTYMYATLKASVSLGSCSRYNTHSRIQSLINIIIIIIKAQKNYLFVLSIFK